MLELVVVWNTTTHYEIKQLVHLEVGEIQILAVPGHLDSIVKLDMDLSSHIAP